MALRNIIPFLQLSCFSLRPERSEGLPFLRLAITGGYTHIQLALHKLPRILEFWDETWQDWSLAIAGGDIWLIF